MKSVGYFHSSASSIFAANPHGGVASGQFQIEPGKPEAYRYVRRQSREYWLCDRFYNPLLYGRANVPNGFASKVLRLVL